MFEGRMRLQIRTEARAAGTVVNSLVNSNGDAGSYGWTNTSGSTWTWVANQAAPKYASGGTGTTQYASKTVPVVAGNVIDVDMGITGTVHITTDGTNFFEKDCVQTRVGIQTMNGATVVATTYSAWHTHAKSAGPFSNQYVWNHAPSNVTVPGSGVNGARVVMEMALTTTGNTHGATTSVGGGNTPGHTISFSGTMFVTTSTPPAPAVVGTDWLDLWGSSASIETDRGELDLGTLHADIYDADLDPNKNSQMHRGAQVRLQAMDVDGVWQNEFVGHVTDIKTTYSKEGKPHVSLNASDAVADLANDYEDDGYDNLSDAASAIYNAHKVPVAINGHTYNPVDDGNPTGVTPAGDYINPEQTLLNVVSVARDSSQGYAWIDKDGVLQLYDAASLPNYGGQIGFFDEYNPAETVRTNLILNPDNVGSTWSVVTGKYQPNTGTPPTITAGGGNVSWPGTGSTTTFRPNYTFGVSVKAGAKDLYVYGYTDGGGAGGSLAYLHTLPDVNAAVPTRWTVPAGTTARISFNSNYMWRTNQNGTGTWSAGSNWQPGIVLNHVDATGFSATGVVVSNAMSEAQPEVGPNVYFPDLVEKTYFSGDSVGASWTGTVNASTSTKDPARYVSYSDIDAGFSTTDVINSIKVTTLGFDALGETVETDAGTYQDAASVLKYGLYQKEITVVGTVSASTLAAAILAKSATPTVKVESLVMPVKDENSFAKAQKADIYTDVEIQYSDEDGVVYSGGVMITSIKNKITASRKYGMKWSVVYGFRPSDAVAAFVGNPPPVQDAAFAPVLNKSLQANITATTTTYVTTGPSVTVQAGKTYHFRAHGLYQSSLTTIGMGVRLNGSATATNIRHTLTTWGSATSASTPVKVSAAALTTANARTTTFAATTPYEWEAEGVITVNAGGTLRVEFNASAAGTITVFRGAVLMLTEVP